ncbi:MAG: hypothetical protein ACJ75H_06085 [Thermoanaerobaculia bacterium]
MKNEAKQTVAVETDGLTADGPVTVMIRVELKPERIQEPLAAAEGGSMVFELALLQSQPVTIAFGAMQVTITLHGAGAATPVAV